MEHPITLPLPLIEKVLARLILPSLELLYYLRPNREGDGLSSLLRNGLGKLNIHSWAMLYLDPENEAKAKILMLHTPDDFNELVRQYQTVDADKQQEMVVSLLENAIELSYQLESDVNDPEEFDSAAFEALPEEDKKAEVYQMQLFLFFLMPNLFNTLSVMVHGKSIFQLVAEATAGNQQSFLDAIQIDKSILTTIPYFIDRNRQAADEGDFSLLRKINTYRNKPALLTRVQYQTLYLVFATLDDMNLLSEFEKDMPRFAYFCQCLRVFGPPPEKEAVDVEAFRGRLRTFKKKHVRLYPTPTQLLLVKDVSSSN